MVVGLALFILFLDCFVETSLSDLVISFGLLFLNCVRFSPLRSSFDKYCPCLLFSYLSLVDWEISGLLFVRYLELFQFPAILSLIRKYNFQGYFAFKNHRQKAESINEPCPLEKKKYFVYYYDDKMQPKKKLPCQDIFSWQNERRTRDDGWIQ